MHGFGLLEIKISVVFYKNHVLTGCLITLCAKLGYSLIKIDHIGDSLLKLQIKIGMHLVYAVATPYSGVREGRKFSGIQFSRSRMQTIIF